ncbi:MAG: glycogen debranching N-terminal domain-containing protein [Actinomycetota bacterium]|jgi:glycogen debranching enzyme
MAVADPWTFSGTSASLGLLGGAVTLVEGPAFSISGRSGDMLPDTPQGLFFRDTRFLSRFEVRVNDQRPEPLSAERTTPFSATFVQRSHPRSGQADSSLLVFRRRYVGRGMREDVAVHNYGEEAAYCSLELTLNADFADLFEVKEGRPRTDGDVQVDTVEGRDGLHHLLFRYRRGGVHKGLRVSIVGSPHLSDNIASFELIVPARGEWSTCLLFTPIIDQEEIEPRYRCGIPVEQAMPQARLEKWRREVPAVQTDYAPLQASVDQSAEDLGALRIFDPDFPERTVIAAGAPWFMTLFGRDSLLTSYMALILDPDLALGVLQTLARFQGRKVDPRSEEEPGRILHEMRFGEAPSLSLGGGRVYYGTADATPLFVMLLGELRRWGLAPELVDSLLPHVERAMEWIEKFGDRDGDGYVEYKRYSDRGLQNQGWKDSWNAIRFADGRLARAPIALAEVQGYTYAAYLARAYFADEMDDPSTAARYRAKAATLKDSFNRDFWIEDRGWFAMGLDADKVPIDAMASNIGHCLWTGIVDQERAPLVAKSLLSDEMFSGWGIRTLAESMVGYNPISYHNGSVWPHDNALCAAGLMRYGFVEEAHRVIGGIIDAAVHQGHRLPELFGGTSRRDLPFPVSYPSSCSPQAWAAASPLLCLRTVLRLDPWMPHHKVWMAPALPSWMNRLRIDRVPLGGRRVTVEVDGDDLHVEGLTDDIELLREPRRPLTA